MSPEPPDDDAEALAQLGSELRQRVGHEFRADAEEGERLADQARRRKRTLAGVARELMARGDTVLVVVGDRNVTGTVRHAAGDLLTLATTGGRVDVNLTAPALLRVVERATAGGLEPDSGPGSFKARLYELELQGRRVEVGCRLLGTGVRARIDAVAVDHVTLADDDGATWFVPLAAIEWLAER